MSYIDISGISKAEALMRLFNGGFNDVNHDPMAGLLQRMMPPMTLDQAQKHIDGNPRMYFDYVDAKCLKVDLSKDKLDPRLYDRDCGRGAAARALGLPEVQESEQ